MLVFALKQLELGEPLENRISDFRSTGLVPVLNDRNVCVESLEICLLALLRVDCRVDFVADWFPGTGAVGERVPQEVGTGEIDRSAPTSKIDLLVAPKLCLCRPDDRV
ncbi:MAG: hypothetical protein WAK13_07230 [Terriglobales bacterium]